MIPVCPMMGHDWMYLNLESWGVKCCLDSRRCPATCKARLLSSSSLGEYGKEMLKLLGWLLPVLLSVWLVVLQQCSNSVCFGFLPSPSCVLLFWV